MGWGARDRTDEKERRLRRLQHAFRCVSEKIDRRKRWRRRCSSLGDVLAPLAVTSLTVLAAFALWLTSLPASWTVADRLRHFLAAPGCGAARALGVAPADRGRPGYYILHDADGDGVACEPFVPDRNLTVRLLMAVAAENFRRSQAAVPQQGQRPE